MKEIMEGQNDTPPSSVNGDEVMGLDDEDMIYVEEIEEIDLDDENGENFAYQDEEADEDMEPPIDFAVLVFSKHTGSVFCCDIHPDGKLAVTGGEDDKAYVWALETGEVIMDCVGHKDSIVFVGFSHDGEYLSTVDMGGLIKVWKCNLEENQQKPWTLAFEYEVDDVIWGQWHFGTRVLLIGTVSGNIYVLKVPTGETKVLQGHHLKVECCKLLQDGVRLVAGYGDGVVKIWDLKRSTVLHSLPASSHRVVAIDCHPENTLLASISSEGKAVLSTTTNLKMVGELEIEDQLETVAFAPESGLIAFGTLTGAVSVWNAATTKVHHNLSSSESDHSSGVTKLIWIKNFLLTGCLDGSIRGYNAAVGELDFHLTGHRSEVLDFCYNAKQNVILTTSDDGTARIFSLKETGVSWNKDNI